ncbi:MAG: ABC transporter substrate-binding protein [Deltaproteobacteria bacterium]|nr:ABC transporter substrate-binding protein [Deltaproteobacteria bacterium]
MHHFLALLIVAIVSFCGHTDGLTQSKELSRIRVSYSSIGAASLATWLALDAGFFQKYALDVGLIYIGGGPRAMSTTIANETQITQGAGTGSILAKLGGADTVMFATLLDTTPQSLMVNANIRSPQDLKGKKLGVTRFGALSDFGVRKYLQKIGLDAEKDVTILQLGGLAEILAALQSGAIHGGALSSPALTKAKQLGFNEMIDLGDLGIRYPGLSYMTTEAYIKTNRPIVSNFLKAIIESTHYLKRNKEVSIRVLKKYTKIDEPAVLEETYQLFTQRYFRLVPTSSAEEVKTVLDQIKDKDPRARTTDYDSFIRGDVLREIVQSGFFKQLAKG